MSGLFAAILLRRAGWHAEIYERAAAELSGRGAGIVTHAPMCAVLRAAGCDPSRDLGIDVAGRRTLDRSGRVIARRAANLRVLRRGRELGAYLQPTLATNAEREQAERHRTPEAVMAEIAVLDFPGA